MSEMREYMIFKKYITKKIFNILYEFLMLRHV